MPMLLEALDSEDEGGEGGRAKKKGEHNQAPSRKEQGTADSSGSSKDRKLGEVKGGHRQLMLLMLKQVLKLSQGQRDLAAAVFDTFIVKSSLVPVVSMQQQTKAYSQQVKKMGKKHQLGSPHVWAYGGMVAGLLGKHSEGIGTKNKEALSGH